MPPVRSRANKVKKPQTTSWRTQTETAHIERLRAAREARNAQNIISLDRRPENFVQMNRRRAWETVDRPPQRPSVDRVPPTYKFPQGE